MRSYLRLLGKGSGVVETERSKSRKKRGIKAKRRRVWGPWNQE